MKKFLLFTLAMIISLSVQNTQAQWEECNNGIYGGNVYDVVGNGNYIMGYTYYQLGGIYLSSDNGDNWIRKNSGLEHTEVKSIAIDEDMFFALCKDGLYKSTDNAESWLQINSEISYYGHLMTNGEKIIAAIDSTIFISSDKGENWTKSYPGPKTRVNSIVINGNTIIVGYDYHGIFISTDNGESWIQKNTGLPGIPGNDITCLSIAQKDGIIFLSLYNNGIFISTDNGDNWIQKNSEIRIGSIIVKENTIFVSDRLVGIFCSTDNGESWVQKTTGFTEAWIQKLSLVGDNIYAATYDGVFLSTDNGDSWTHKKAGITAVRMLAIAIEGNNIFAGASRSGGVFLSTDNGTNWTVRNSGLTNTYVKSFTFAGNNLYAGTSRGVFFSSDNGENWIERNEGLSSDNQKIVNSLLTIGNNIFAGTREGVYIRNVDNGEWEGRNEGLQYSFGSANVEALAVNGDKFFAGTYGAAIKGVFLSTDEGDSWSEKNSGLTNTLVLELAISGNNIFAGTYGGGGLFLSTDNGNSWTDINSRLHDKPQYGIMSILTADNNVFVGVANLGLYLSTDNGNSWEEKNSGLIDKRQIEALAISGEFIYAGTHSAGIFKAKLSDFGITVSTEEQKVSNLSIYPNPTSDFLNLHFDNLSQINLSNIKIYSLFGIEIQLNVKSISENNIEFDVSSLPQGVYFVTVSIGDRVERMKFVRINN